MLKFFIRNQKSEELTPDVCTAKSNQPQTKRRRMDLNLEDLPCDPGLRSRISDYNPKEQDHSNAYLQKGLVNRQIINFYKLL